MSTAHPNPASIAANAGSAASAWRPQLHPPRPGGGGSSELRSGETEGAPSAPTPTHPQTHPSTNDSNHSPATSPLPGVSDADRALLNALNDPAALDRLDPVTLAAWRNRPEIQQALATRDWIRSLKDEAHNRRLRDELEADNRLAREKLKKTIAAAEHVLDALAASPTQNAAPSTQHAEDDAPSARLRALSELRRAATSLGRLSTRATTGPLYHLLNSSGSTAAQSCARSAPPPCPTCGARSRRRPPSSPPGEVPERGEVRAEGEGAFSSTAASTPRSTTDDHHARNARDSRSHSSPPPSPGQDPPLPVYNFPPCPPGFPERPPPAARPEPSPETEAETEAAAIATVERILDALKHNDEPVPDTGISTAMAFHRWGDPHPPYPWHVFLPDFRGLLSPALVGHTSRSLRVLCYDRISCMIDCRIRVDLEHADGRRAAVTFLMHLPRHTPPGGRKWEYDTIVLIPDPSKRYDTS